MALDNMLGFMVMPILFVLLHAVGLALSLVYWRRCPAACSLLLSGSIMNLIASLGRIGLPFLLQQQGRVPFFSSVMMGLTVMNWLGYGLVLMAVFAGRNEPTRRPSPFLDEDAAAERVSPKPPPSTGIQASG